MSSDAQIQANQQNAQNSTGPKTDEGKAASAQNAVKHGLRSTKVLIPSDDPAQYQAMRNALMEELNPVGASEQLLADRIAALHWQLQRATAMQAECLVAIDKKIYNFDYENKDNCDEGEDLAAAKRRLFDETFGEIVVHDFTSSRVLERLVIYERRIENSLFKTRHELEILQDRRQVRQRQAEELRQRNQELRTARLAEENERSRLQLLSHAHRMTPSMLCNFEQEPLNRTNEPNLDPAQRNAHHFADQNSPNEPNPNRSQTIIRKA